MQPVAQLNESMSGPDEQSGDQGGDVSLLHEKENEAQSRQQGEGQEQLIPGPFSIPGATKQSQRQGDEQIDGKQMHIEELHQQFARIAVKDAGVGQGIAEDVSQRRGVSGLMAEEAHMLAGAVQPPCLDVELTEIPQSQALGRGEIGPHLLTDGPHAGFLMHLGQIGEDGQQEDHAQQQGIAQVSDAGRAAQRPQAQNQTHRAQIHHGLGPHVVGQGQEYPRQRDIQDAPALKGPKSEENPGHGQGPVRRFGHGAPVQRHDGGGRSQGDEESRGQSAFGAVDAAGQKVDDQRQPCPEQDVAPVAGAGHVAGQTRKRGGDEGIAGRVMIIPILVKPKMIALPVEPVAPQPQIKRLITPNHAIHPGVNRTQDKSQ